MAAAVTSLLIGGSRLHCVDQPAAGVDADVALHAEAPFLSLFRLMHFRVACLLRVLCRSGRVDNDGVHDRAALHHGTGDFHNAVDGIEEQLVQTVFLQQMPKLAKHRLVRDTLGH